MRCVRRVLVLFGLVLFGCVDPSAPEEDLREQYALSRLSLDPLTELGSVVGREPSLADQFGIVFDIANCDGAGPVVVDLEATRTGTRAAGTLTMVIGVVQDGDPCAGTGHFTADPSSFAESGAPLVHGPLYIEGTTAEARLPLSRIDSSLLGFLPVWWSVTARRRQGSEALGDAEARALWRLAHLAATPSPRIEGQSLLDELVGLGAEPDLDVDRDGLERVEDVDGDGRVDRCVDGDGATQDGADCVRDKRFVDGYELILRFRMVPAELAD